ncbi:hypothetical protein [Modestobacter sp. VKM Ac-2984]|uniref:hypothetical protein n=1 Tax=Modestobacter sp. VKM Ac-2984 TaxID=3004138 RepID=UPI0022AAB335|nr:hypothetical protein [Modestobacter sp. VKM Ac-2984]MCZ2817264.1 hypothetical protein [Modestobacter sp. VKM Ac-2984]
MGLNAAVENALRDTYRAILADDRDMLVEALGAYEEVGVMETFAMAQVLLPATLATLHGGRLPSEQIARQLAQRVTDEEGTNWAPLPPAESFATVLVRACGHEIDHQVDPRDLIMILVIATANLLRHPPDGWEWNRVLDHVEELLEASV